MKLEQSFTVDAPLQRVWAALIDVERVAPCLPGAEITGSEDGTYHGQFSVKLGPTTAAYRGTLKMEAIDADTHTATMQARGTDKRGQGGANATIVSRVVEDAERGGTRVDVVTDFTITGRLARFGRGGMIEDISKRLLKDFAECLQATLTAEPAAAGEGAASRAPVVAPPPSAAPAAAAPTAPPRPPARPVRALPMLLGVLWDRLRRLFRRGR